MNNSPYMPTAAAHQLGAGHLVVDNYQPTIQPPESYQSSSQLLQTFDGQMGVSADSNYQKTSNNQISTSGT